MSAALQSGLLAWVHFGDLHVTGAEAPNYRDAVALIEEVDANMREGVAFAVLPGDNAEDGTPHQFGLVRAALDRLALRVHILPGDHDRASGSLQSFYDTLGGERLPVSIVREGYTCLFLDIVSAGAGGPDFRLGPGQHDWLERELDRAAAEHRRSIVFMHAYPADLAERSSEVTALFARHAVAVVDMGHTHYNELANDGRTIYAATRSTGQNEEGRPGFSVLAVDGGLVSWRFKPLGEPWPLALITAPADRRLQTDASPPSDGANLQVRALGWSAHGIRAARCSLDGGPWRPMRRDAGSPAWRHDSDAPPGAHRIVVEIEDGSGRVGSDAIETAGPGEAGPTSPPRGSDAHSVGAWPERHILGTQLGPNRNGRHW